ncbi:hypothetical protein JCM11641_001409 [Rhodosporidiobolus odoratus]
MPSQHDHQPHASSTNNHASGSSGSGVSGEGIPDNALGLTPSGTINPSSLQPLPSSSSTSTSARPFTPQKDAALARTVLDRLEKNKGEEIKWKKVKKELDKRVNGGEGRGKGEWKARWEELKGMAWPPHLTSLLLAASSHYLSQSTTSPTAAQTLLEPTTTPTACVAWIVVRERAKRYPSQVDGEEEEEANPGERHFEECRKRYLSALEKRKTAGASLRSAGATDEGKLKHGGGMIWALRVVEKVTELGGRIEFPNAGWVGEEGLAKWVKVGSEVRGEGQDDVEGRVDFGLGEIVGMWEEGRIKVLADVLDAAPPPPTPTTCKKKKPKGKKVKIETADMAAYGDEVRGTKRKRGASSDTTNGRQPWTPQQDQDLRRMHLEEELDWHDIAQGLGRSEAAVKQHWMLQKGKWDKEGLLGNAKSSSSPTTADSASHISPSQAVSSPTTYRPSASNSCHSPVASTSAAASHAQPGDIPVGDSAILYVYKDDEDEDSEEDEEEDEDEEDEEVEEEDELVSDSVSSGSPRIGARDSRGRGMGSGYESSVSPQPEGIILGPSSSEWKGKGKEKAEEKEVQREKKRKRVV